MGIRAWMPAVAFASRKQALTVYASLDVAQHPEPERLEKFTHGKGRLHIKRLPDIRLGMLETILKRAYQGALGHDFVTPLEY